MQVIKIAYDKSKDITRNKQIHKKLEELEIEDNMRYKYSKIIQPYAPIA